jgi:ABC-type sulfate transport system permease component
MERDQATMLLACLAWLVALATGIATYFGAPMPYALACLGDGRTVGAYIVTACLAIPAAFPCLVCGAVIVAEGIDAWKGRGK